MLDVSVRAGVLRLLDSLREGGLGILMITHDLSTAASYADRIAVMYLGRIVEEGPAEAVVRDPQHPYTKALLSVVPRRDPRERSRPQILTGEAPDAVRIPPGCRFHPRCPVAIADCREIDPALEPAAPGPDTGPRASSLAEPRRRRDRRRELPRRRREGDLDVAAARLPDLDPGRAGRGAGRDRRHRRRRVGSSEAGRRSAGRRPCAPQDDRDRRLLGDRGVERADRRRDRRVAGRRAPHRRLAHPRACALRLAARS